MALGRRFQLAVNPVEPTSVASVAVGARKPSTLMKFDIALTESPSTLFR